MKNINYKSKIMIILLIILCITGCGKQDKTYADRKEEELQNLASQRVEKMASIKKEDGWYYYFMITYLGENKNKIYSFNGCNLKYSHLTDYNILITDKEGKILNRLPTQPTLAVSEKSINNVMERDEILTINAYFNEMQFSNKITLDDFNDLEIVNFSKKEIIDIFNKAQDVEYKKQFGKYNLSDCLVYEENIKEDGKIQIGVLMSWGNFEAIELDINYGDNIYLSDKVKNGTASLKEKEIYDNFQKVEEYMLEFQDINISSKFPTLNEDIYSRLFLFIESLGDK